MATKADGIAAGMGITFILVWVAQVVFYLTGVVVAFSNAWWIGILCLFPIAGWVNGLVYIGTWGNADLSLKLMTWIVSSAFGLPPVV